MFIKLAKVFGYDDTGWNCREAQLRSPTWDQLEAAVKRLNKFQFPFVWFFSSLDVRDDDVPDFEIMGGDGDYVVAVNDAEGNHRRVRFAAEGDRWIPVWLSDQGCDAKEQFVCHDVDRVLAILRQFAEAGRIPQDVELE